MTKQKKVMTFGTFDGVHQGHENLLTQAKKLGNELIVVVAQDATVLKLKGKNCFLFFNTLKLLLFNKSGKLLCEKLFYVYNHPNNFDNNNNNLAVLL